MSKNKVQEGPARESRDDMDLDTETWDAQSTVAGFRARKSNEEREAQRRSRTGRLENGARARAGPEEAF